MVEQWVGVLCVCLGEGSWLKICAYMKIYCTTSFIWE